MVNMLFPVSAALCLSILTACGQNANHSSKLDGHYEGSSAHEMSAYQGAQRLTAEYEESRGVIIALPILTDFHKESMAKAILDSGVETLWITVPSTYRGSLETSSEFARLRKVLGDDISKVQLVPVKDAGNLTIWARDWSPLGAKTADGRLRLLDLNYYSNRRADDSTARGLEYNNILDFDRVSVPVYNEGGNFMNNRKGHCMMTTRVTDANEEMERSDDMILDADQIKSYYQNSGGCTTVTIFPRIPYEGTGHIDMWAKFLTDDTLIVNEIRNEVVNLPQYSERSRQKVRNLQSYLNDRAREIKSFGYRVIRLPMPAPMFDQDGGTFRSYTNSLTVNGVAVTPRYTEPAGGVDNENGFYWDEGLRVKYENEVRSVYESLGYQFSWIDADDMIATGGAVHCTTMQVPL